MIHARVRSQIHPDEMAQKVGKIITEDDYNVLLTGAATIQRPSGAPLLVYLPGAMSGVITPEVYDILHSVRPMLTDNRGHASGSPRVRYGDEKRTRTKKVASMIMGALDSKSAAKPCRQAAWTRDHPDEMATLAPVFQRIDECYREHLPKLYAVQAEYARKTHPDWVIPGTVFTTITVNNTYPTGVHQDSGDLAAASSTLFCIRRGNYTGGRLVLAEYRLAVDMQDNDLVLFDAHAWHGNTRITPLSDDAERITVVSYYRERLVDCGSSQEELRKAERYAEMRGGTYVPGDGVPDDD